MFPTQILMIRPLEGRSIVSGTTFGGDAVTRGVAWAAVVAGWLAASAAMAADSPGGAVPAAPQRCEAVAANGGDVRVAKSGCCSRHGGVSGCRDGRQVCADGSLSPSCRC